MFKYTVRYITNDGKVKVANCSGSISIAKAIACKRLNEGAQEAIIIVEKSNDEDADPLTVVEVETLPLEEEKID